MPQYIRLRGPFFWNVPQIEWTADKYVRRFTGIFVIGGNFGRHIFFLHAQKMSTPLDRCMQEADAAFSALVESGESGVPAERIVWCVKDESGGTGLKFDWFGCMGSPREMFRLVQKNHYENGDRQKIHGWKLMDWDDVHSVHEFFYDSSRKELDEWALGLQIHLLRQDADRFSETVRYMISRPKFITY